MTRSIRDLQSAYWRRKIEADPDSPGSVGSESTEHKRLRYEKITGVFGDEQGFSVADVGAGVGDLYGHLLGESPRREFSYLGIEIVPEYVQAAQVKYPGIQMQVQDIIEQPLERSHDFVVMSGVFHQPGEVAQEAWSRFIRRMLLAGYKACRKGIAFNVLTPHVDFMREGNHHVNLLDLQRFLVEEMSRFVVMDHSYPLFEATFFIYRPGYLRSLHSGGPFERYIGE